MTFLETNWKATLPRMQSQIKLKLIDPVHVPENKMMWKVGRMIEPTYEGRSQITWTFWIRKIFNESMSYTPYSSNERFLQNCWLLRTCVITAHTMSLDSATSRSNKYVRIHIWMYSISTIFILSSLKNILVYLEYFQKLQ